MYRIKGWHKFQHFKDRKPPWIKLYRDLLDDVEWHNLDAKAAKALVMLWLIASEDDGNLPNVKTLAFRLRVPENEMKSIVSKLSHWLGQDDINAISGRYQDDTLETETETETEKEKETEREVERARPTRLPKNWMPNENDLAFAEEQGVHVPNEIGRFRDYWLSKARDNTKLDWSATWRNWCRRADKRVATRQEKLLDFVNSIEERGNVFEIGSASGSDSYVSLPNPKRG